MQKNDSQTAAIQFVSKALSIKDVLDVDTLQTELAVKNMDNRDASGLCSPLCFRGCALDRDTDTPSRTDALGSLGLLFLFA